MMKIRTFKYFFINMLIKNITGCILRQNKGTDIF